MLHPPTLGHAAQRPSPSHLQNSGCKMADGSFATLTSKMADGNFATVAKWRVPPTTQPPDNRLGGAAQRPGPCGSSILLGINRQGWGMASGISQWSLNSCRLLPVGKWRSVGILLAGQMILKSADKQELFSVINSIVYHVTEVGKNG